MPGCLTSHISEKQLKSVAIRQLSNPSECQLERLTSEWWGRYIKIELHKTVVITVQLKDTQRSWKLRLKRGRKLCKWFSPESKHQKNVSWESILLEPHYLRLRVGVDEVVFHWPGWLRKRDLTLSKESNMQKPGKEIRFLRDSRKRQTWDWKKEAQVNAWRSGFWSQLWR